MEMRADRIFIIVILTVVAGFIVFLILENTEPVTDKIKDVTVSDENQTEQDIIDDKEDTGIIDDQETKDIIDDKEDTGVIDDQETKDIIDDKEDTGIIDDQEDTGVIDDQETKDIIDDKEETESKTKEESPAAGQDYLEIQESITLINADKVWQMGYTGKGIVVAVIDSGIDYTHPDFGSCTVEDIKTGNCEQILDAYNFVDDNDDPMDDKGHGTHVAGIIAGTGAASDGKYIGVAPDSKLIAYKVGHKFGVNEIALKKAINRAMDPNEDGDTSDHVDIISMSVGLPKSVLEKEGIYDAMEKAMSLDIVLVVSAANNGDFNRNNITDYLTIGPPGEQKDAIVVGSVSKEDEIQLYSSRGAGLIDYIPQCSISGCIKDESYEVAVKPDVLGAGGAIGTLSQSEPYPEIVSAASLHVLNDPDLCIHFGRELDRCLDNELTVDEYYYRMIGTSMSAPMVSGAVALIKQAHPDWTSEQIKAALMNSAVGLGSDVNSEGAGRIDVLKAVKTEVFVTPSVLDSERVDSEVSVWSDSNTLKVRNTGDSDLEFTLSFDLDETGINASYIAPYINAVEHSTESLSGITGVFSSDTIRMSADSETSFEFTIRVDNSKVPDGTYGGRIVLDSDSQSLRIPFFYYKGLKPRAIVLCFDGTPLGECSMEYQGMLCVPQGLADQCNECGCDEGYTCYQPPNAGNSICISDKEICPDGTLIGDCSKNLYGFFCKHNSIRDSTDLDFVLHCFDCDPESDCPAGMSCTSREESPIDICLSTDYIDGETCYDGTPVGECSTNEGYECKSRINEYNIEMINYEPNCEKCGCPDSWSCETETGICIAPDIECEKNYFDLLDKNFLFCTTTKNDSLYEPSCTGDSCIEDEPPETCTDCDVSGTTCSDGTKESQCSTENPGKICVRHPEEGVTLIDNPMCGESGDTCSDGTKVSECSTEDSTKLCIRTPDGLELMDNPRCDGTSPSRPSQRTLPEQYQAVIIEDLTCTDGTLIGNCSITSDGMMCMKTPKRALELLPNPACFGSNPWEPPVQYEVDESQTCEDGSKVLECSSNKPKLCLPDPQDNYGRLLDNCMMCGCPDGETCVEPRTFDREVAAEEGILPGRCYKDLEPLPSPSFTRPNISEIEHIVPIGRLRPKLSPNRFEITRPEISSGKVKIGVGLPDISIREISFEASAEASNVTFILTRLEPENIRDNLEGNVYQYIDMKYEGLESQNIESVTIEFKVDKDWMNDIDLSSIALYRYNDKWEKLATSWLREDQKYLFYKAESPGLSVFAVASDEDSEPDLHRLLIFLTGIITLLVVLTVVFLPKKN